MNSLPYTTIDISPGVRVDLFTPTAFRLRRSKLKPDPFPPAYEIPFAMAGGAWDPVRFERSEGPMVTSLRTDRLAIHVQLGGYQILVEDVASGRRLYPSTSPRHGLCRNGCMVFDSAGAPDEPTTCSRHAHWFLDPASGLYEVFLPGDDLLDLFFIHGPGYPELFAQFNRLVGPEPLLARKGYGFQQTQHLGFVGDQGMLLRTVAEFRRRGLPLDTIILDFEWGDGSTGTAKADWGSRLDWASSYTAPLSPAALLAELRAQHVDVMLIHHSVPEYPGRSGEAWVCHAYPPEQWWGALQEKLDIGVTGTWQDTRQSDISDARIHAGLQARLGPGRRAAFLGNYELYFDCNWTRITHPVPSMSLIGNRRAAAHWTGDKSNNRWSELRFQVASIVNHHGSLRGISHLCDDMMRSADWRLAVRSLQFHCLSTLARSHNLKPWQVHGSFEAAENMAITGNLADGTTRDPAKIQADRLLGLDRPHATQEALFRRFLELRYRLLPYLYTQVHTCWRSGMPVCRPMLLAFPDDAACNADQWPTQYLLGPDLLVAPVVDPDPTLDVYLPLGADWIDFWDGSRHSGGQVLRLSTEDLSRLPLFVRHGAAIATQETCAWIEPGRNPDPLVVELWPSIEGGSGLLIEDDGLSLDYQQGRTAETTITCRLSGDEVTVDIAPVVGTYTGMPGERRVELRLHLPGRTAVKASASVPTRLAHEAGIATVGLGVVAAKGDRVRIAFEA